jgi:threonine synthase
VAANKAGLDPAVPMVVLATAAPAKFPDTMRDVAGIEAPLPARLFRLMTDPERMTPVANDGAVLEMFIRSQRQAS